MYSPDNHPTFDEINTDITTLRNARDLIQQGFCKRTSATCVLDIPEDPFGRRARKFSLAGAVARGSITEDSHTRCRALLRQHLAPVYKGNIDSWNDRPQRTQAHVLALLDDVIGELGIYNNLANKEAYAPEGAKATQRHTPREKL